MPLWLQMSRNYNNPESVNYKLAYLREQMKQQLLNLGDLAYEDQVQLAMLGDTIQIGGYLRTELIAANSIVGDKIAANSIVGDKIASNAIVARHIQANAITSDKIAANSIVGNKIASNAIVARHIQANAITSDKIAARSIKAEHLTVDDLAAISAKFTGDVYIGGDVVVGGQGVLSVFQFVSNGFNEGWGDFGISSVGGDIYKGRVSLPVSIPANFSITKAIIKLQAMPVYLNDVMNPSNNGWRQSRNLKLYYSPGNEGWHNYVLPGSVTPPLWRSGIDITSAVLGVSLWSPPLQYRGTNPANASNKIQYRSGSILNYLAPGQTTVFYVETTDTPSVTTLRANLGQGRLVVTVEGYARPE